MASLVGQYESTLDQKNRLIVPHKLRAIGGSKDNPAATFVLAPGPERCILAYTPEAWEATAAAIIQGKRLPNRERRRFQRRIGSMADYIACDRQGRIVLPEKLREHAQLGRNVVWVGAIDRAEIWDAGEWARYNESDKAYDDIFDEIAGQSDRED